MLAPDLYLTCPSSQLRFEKSEQLRLDLDAAKRTSAKLQGGCLVGVKGGEGATCRSREGAGEWVLVVGRQAKCTGRVGAG